SYPQYLPIFLKERRGEDLFKDEGLKYIFTHLKSIFEEDGAVDARQLLARVQDPAMESKIAAIMLDAPTYTGTKVESVVQDLLTKVQGRELQRQTKMLLGQIKEAERTKQYGVANNAAKELMEEHKKLLVRHKG
ncbi:MAG: hypothetical protein Q8N82_05240, partial [Deltaproteobacteria bacterium]|nr:hypothetical protein [Deltaproteobacteria bacterium]